MTDAAFPVDVYQGLVARGIPASAALGAAAGVGAEGGTPTAVNPKSGAFGYGQWVGPRKDALFSAYGGKPPTADQQIDYLAWEMKGGDKGMASVIGAADPHTAAQVYLANGMRPGPGLPGDLQRAQAILANAPGDASVIPNAQPKGGDPFDPGGDTSPNPPVNVKPDPNDPFDPYGHLVHGVGGNSPQAGAGAGGVPDNAAGRNLQRPVQGTGSGAQGGPPGGLQQDTINLHDVAQTVGGTTDAAVNGFTAGLIKPFNAALDTIIPNAVNGQKSATVWDGSSLGDAFHRDLALERGQAEQFGQDHPVASTVSDLTGALASPANKLFAPAEGAGFFRSIPNFMAQGATYGGVRGGADTGTVKGALEDAGAGAVLAPVGAAAANVGGKLLGAALRARSTLASAIPQSVKQQVASMIDRGASADDIVSAIPEAKGIAHIPDWVNYRAKGGKSPVTWGSPPPPEAAAEDEAPIVITAPRNKQLAAALGTQGSRRGVESVTDIPQPVQGDVLRLTQAGVSPEEAQREADIRYVGGKPTVAAVTRDPAEQWAFNEGAKDTSTASGQALNDTQAANNGALHNTLIQTVDNYGGVPAQGEASQTAAEALAKASDASRAKVNGLYTKARAADGDVRINTDELRELLQSPEMATPTNPQVQQLSNGILSHLQAVDQRAGTTLRTPEEIEQIRHLANGAYDPMGGPVNNAVGKVGGALNDSLDQLDQASAAWKAARAAHREWANQYSDPAGVAQLIARDAKGNFLNADQWRLNENGLIDRLNDKPFAQVVGQLKKTDATDALDKLKAGIVQRAYERATNSARDKLGNPVVNGKLFQNELNKIGLPKLKALFSPNEIAHLATVGRAARAVNEPVPGTLNTSNTAAAVNRTQTSLAAALQAKPGAHPLITVGKAGLAVTGHLPAAIGVHAMETLSSKAAANAVGQGIREQLNPALARAVAARSQTRIGNAQFRSAMGRALRNRGAVPAADNDRGKTIGRRLNGAL